jgi:hypothetical protein
MRKDGRATFLVETNMRPGEYTLIDVDGTYHLVLWRAND